MSVSYSQIVQTDKMGEGETKRREEEGEVEERETGRGGEEEKREGRGEWNDIETENDKASLTMC